MLIQVDSAGPTYPHQVQGLLAYDVSKSQLIFGTVSSKCFVATDWYEDATERFYSFRIIHTATITTRLSRVYYTPRFWNRPTSPAYFPAMQGRSTNFATKKQLLLKVESFFQIYITTDPLAQSGVSESLLELKAPYWLSPDEHVFYRIAVWKFGDSIVIVFKMNLIINTTI